jgi:hypothetical protein
VAGTGFYGVSAAVFGSGAGWRGDLRVILVGALVLDVVLVVQVLDVLLGLVLGPLTVDEVQSLGLGELVDLRAGETDEEFFGELMGDGLSCGPRRGQFRFK